MSGRGSAAQIVSISIKPEYMEHRGNLLRILSPATAWGLPSGETTMAIFGCSAEWDTISAEITDY